jgi:hypothetical protein
MTTAARNDGHQTGNVIAKARHIAGPDAIGSTQGVEFDEGLCPRLFSKSFTFFAVFALFRLTFFLRRGMMGKRPERRGALYERKVGT